MTLDVHIVSHTHWDREWYHPVERFRQRLVALIDDLLDDPPRDGESFLLDGQVIIIEDYLAIRPERREELAALLQAGRLEAGPWYVLADELIPSGEALVRNLFAGRRALRRLDASPPPVLYCPDSFGHPASLPAIAAGFGFPIVILWRGYGGPRWPAGDAARWVAPSGDAAFLFHLPRDGYEFGSHLPSDVDLARDRWHRVRAELAPRSTTGVTLLPNGADHHARQADWRDAFSAMQAVAEGDHVHRSSLRAFTDHFTRAASARALPDVRGELRDSYGYTWSLQGTFGTRAHEKRLNAMAERLLLREAEPWSALAAHRHHTQRALLDAAWRTLLTAHPHDTLCGCSVDEVAGAMELRLRSATNQAVGIRDDAIAQLIGYDAAAAREQRAAWRSVVLVRNAAPRQRSGVAVIDVEEFIADVPVGPGSAPERAIAATLPKKRPCSGLGDVQVLSRRLAYSRTESPHHYPDNDLVAVARVAAWVPDVPPYGIASYPLGARPEQHPAPDRVAASRSELRNGSLLVTVSEAGVVVLNHLVTGRRIESLFVLLDERDVGDLYTPAPRERAFAMQFRGARVVHKGPLRGEIALTYRIMDSERSRAEIAEIVVHLGLDAGSELLRLSVRGENKAENHRLRLIVSSDIRGRSVFADAAFGVVRRQPISVAPEEAAVERPPSTAPLHRYVSRFDDESGMTLFSDGLAEYEARDDGSLAVTLVRAVGELSRNDLPERPGHAGWPTPTPRAQCLGPFGAELAVLLHGPRTAETIDLIERASDDVLEPLVGTALRSALAVPAPVYGVELFGRGLAFSTIKESEDGDWLVLRCINLLDEPVDGGWRLPFDVTSARLARLDETVIDGLDAVGREVRLHVPPHAIVTVLVG